MRKESAVKRIAIVLAAVAVIAGAGLNGHMTAEAARKVKTQMMEITCPHCHKYITIDVLKDDVECTKCHSNIHIDG